MRLLCVLVFIISAFDSIGASTIEERTSSIGKLIRSNPDSAYLLALDLKAESFSKDDQYGIVNSNYILAYIHDEIEAEFGKAIIYYLEAIRYAEQSTDENIRSTLISLYKNCGVIFRKFNAFELAISYYEKGIDLAKIQGNESQTISSLYNLSGVYMDMELFNEAISILEQIQITLDSKNHKYYDITNRLAICYMENGQGDQAQELAELVINSSLDKGLKTVDSYQIMGRVSTNSGNFKKAEIYLEKALFIIMMQNNELRSGKSLFETHTYLGDMELANGDHQSALKHFANAEIYMTSTDQNPESFLNYKKQADSYFQIKNFVKSKAYEDLYFSELNNYLSEQQAIQDTDKRFNMDLITKRYFDQVEKQEKISSILFFSRLTSGGLLTLLILVIGYYRFEKIRVRKSIEQQLITLEMLD